MYGEMERLAPANNHSNSDMNGDYLAEFAALNAAGRDSSWEAVAAGSALVVGARIILGEHLDHATSADKLARARSEGLPVLAYRG